MQATLVIFFRTDIKIIIINFFQPSQDLNRCLKKVSADGQLVAVDIDASDGCGQ